MLLNLRTKQLFRNQNIKAYNVFIKSMINQNYANRGINNFIGLTQPELNKKQYNVLRLGAG